MEAYNLENNLNLKELDNSEPNQSLWLQEYQENIEQDLAQAIEQADRLLTPGDDCQIAGLLPEGSAVWLEKKNGKCRAYLDLIHSLLHCPKGLEAEIIAINGDLIDSGLVRIIEQMAANILEQGDRETANFLESCAKEVKRQLIDTETTNLDCSNWTFG
jgi:hypothetical protein